MTMEKAIETLSIIKAYEIDNSIRGAEDREAIDMAIKTLEQQPCEDCISRQAALDAFGLSEKTRKYGGDHSGYDTLMKYEIQDVLEDLPSVTPQPKIGKWEWVQYNSNPNIGDWHCSECRCVVIEGVKKEKKSVIFPLYKYCPGCGAKMEEVEE